MNQNPIPCKVVVIGESGVGKTSIITRYMNNTYYSNFIPTMGNCYASKIIDFQEKDKKIKFEVK